MSPEFYRLLHVIGVLMLFLGLGGVLAGTRDGGKTPPLYLALHGIGLLVMLIAGIGYAHKSGIGFPSWVIAKIGCWVLLAALPTLVKKGLLIRPAAIALVIAVGAAAVWLAQSKPF
ncbi:MAG: hypothetical protein H6838_08540 [Planctomycetes bacterium]|nr:hypothetical protein [Planctomycetota bacterium]MCB9885526.1 hypothetical protein [Planctomycetota bacterium]